MGREKDEWMNEWMNELVIKWKVPPQHHSISLMTYDQHLLGWSFKIIQGNFSWTQSGETCIFTNICMHVDGVWSVVIQGHMLISMNAIKTPRASVELHQSHKLLPSICNPIKFSMWKWKWRHLSNTKKRVHYIQYIHNV